MPYNQDASAVFQPPTASATGLLPSFYVVLIPAIGAATGLGPAQALFAITVLQLAVPAWKAGWFLPFLATPVALAVVGLLALAEFGVDKIPGRDVRLAGPQLRLRPILAGLIAAAAMANQPIDIILIAGFIAALLAAFVHTAILPARRRVLDTGMAPFVTPIVSIVQSLLIGSMIFPLSTLPILGGVVTLVVMLACGMVLVINSEDSRVLWLQLMGVKARGSNPENHDVDGPKNQ